MQDGIWAKIAEVDTIVINQPTKERINGNPKSTEEIVLENN